MLLGSNDCNALIDGGPPGDGIDGKLKHLGVEHLDLVLATHPELDHFGGLADLAAAGTPPVRDFLDGGGAQNVTAFAGVRDGFARHGATTTAAVAGTRWHCGDLDVHLLSPDERAVARPVANANTIAAVAVITVGSMRMLASGDAESPQLAPLALPNVDVLKVPHHGSADPGLPGVLARADPEISIIEVGKNNTYGHPTAQTLQQLGAAGSVVLRTDRDGTVLVSADATGAIQASRIDD